MVPRQSFVRSELRSLGVSFKSLPETGEFKIRHAASGEEYFTNCLQDALDTGRAIFNRHAK